MINSTLKSRPSRRSRCKRGFTVLELVISGTIMVSVIMISFDVMLTGVRISSAAVNASDHRDDARSSIDDIKSSLEQGCGMMTCITSSPKTLNADDSRYFFIRKPALGPAGNVIADKHEIVAYLLQPALKPAEGPFVLLRQSVYMKGMTPVSTEERETILKNVESMQVRYFASRSIAPIGSDYLLPGIAVTSKPSGAEVRVFEMIAPWHSLAVRCSRTESLKPGLDMSVIGASIKTVGNVVSIDVPAVLVKPVDFLLEVDGRNVIDAAEMTNAADNVTVSITQLIKDEHGRSRRETREVNARLKNR